MGNLVNKGAKMFKVEDIRPDVLLKKQKQYIDEDITFLQSKKQKFVRVNCPACDTENVDVELVKNDFEYCECKKCGMLYMNPRPTCDILAEFYPNSPNYKFFNDYIFPASIETRREKIFIPRVQKIINLCRKYNIDTNKILEIGTGSGLFCEEMAKTAVFKDIVGVEASNSLAETCGEMGFRIYNGILENLEINETFDVIVSFEVLEHIFNPKDLLLKSNQLLNKNGIIMLTFPNYNGFEIEILREKSVAIDHEHLNYFNENSISLILESAGFKLLAAETPGQLDVDLVKTEILNGGFKTNRFIENICVNENPELGANFQKFLIENKLSSNMLVIAQKK